MKKSITTTLEQFKNTHYGKPGTPKRDALDTGYEVFKVGTQIQEARKKLGLTQEELADRVGTTKQYISKIENDVKEVRISTLKKIVELGLNGTLSLQILL
ncbi:MAG: helix-turn-helix transcriptional regulator [Ignavibacteria bacterium]|nr:helix-turn-helix transcriptional regulator [Ignavibacteria bacterium]